MRDQFKRYILSNHVLLTTIVIAVAWFLYTIRGIIIELFIAYIIMAALTPFITALKRFKIHNALATGIVYIATLLIIILIIFPLVPFFTAQIQSLIKTFPTYINETSKLLGIKLDVSQMQSVVTSELGTIGENAFAITKNIFNGIFSVLAVFVISVYLALDRTRVHRWFSSLFPAHAKETTESLTREIEEKLGAWVRGQITLSFAIAIVTWLILTLLGIPFALPLAMIAGLLEIIPTLGPIISAIPAMIVALSISPTLMIIVALAYICIQFLENHLLVPKIMEAAVGMNPVIIIVSVAIGANLFGIIGALLAVPFVSALIIVGKYLR